MRSVLVYMNARSAPAQPAATTTHDALYTGKIAAQEVSHDA
jgi:hypothetical protein